ncbi:hypothetical protein [Lignipirellula cremea]|uniref:Uncharacterized protein n=1 Tax=Lignipirellula cremea TaxID=2528010 RepID=A0A518E4A7_9BACT|nr:hypothetical protein [Lignipirellula cremea]QDU98945.1 hypothetical protein Pla8534_68560 [Lignipirellula cremea]
MTEVEMRKLYCELLPGDAVEVIHHVKIGFKEHSTLTRGVVVQRDRRRSGMEGGFARNWDDKCWFDHLTLQKANGEVTTVTMDEYTELRRISSAAS